MSSAAQTFRMLENTSLWTTAQDCHRRLVAARVPHVLVGGMAVFLHGYRRNTVDVDILIRGEDALTVRQALENASYTWSAADVEFRHASGIPVQFLNSGDRAGKGSEVLFPDPASPDCIEHIEGLPVLTLARLIETKLACGLGSPRRTHRDLADVVELIVAHNLSRSFARHLHKSLRDTFRQLVLQSRGG